MTILLIQLFFDIELRPWESLISGPQRDGPQTKWTGPGQAISLQSRTESSELTKRLVDF